MVRPVFADPQDRCRAERATIRAIAFLMALLIGPSALHSQPAGAQAEALFRRGRDLMAGGRFAEACSAFEESEKLEPAVTTLLNLAGCREKLGQIATAWGLFLAAERQTRSATNATTQQLHDVAHNHAQKLEPRVSKLKISVPQKSRIDGLEILRGKEVVIPVMWNSEIPVDGGTYTITARAPGSAVWTVQITIAAEKDAQTVEIPDLHHLTDSTRQPATDKAATEAATGTPPGASNPEPARTASIRRSPPAANPDDEVATGPSSNTTAALTAPARQRRMSWTLARIGGGASIVQRDLSYAMRSGFSQGPPQVRTTAGAIHIEGELYASALYDVPDRLGGLGVAATYDKTLDQGVQPTGSSTIAPVDQAHYDVGLRYQSEIRYVTIVLGLGYAHRHFRIDRSNLSQPLDVPDVSYQAITPTIGVKLPVATSIVLFAAIDGMLIFDTGPIQNTNSYGRLSVYGIEASSGAELIMSRKPYIHGRLALEYSRISLGFEDNNPLTAGRDGDPGTKDINGAIDRSIAVAVTIGLGY
jgi:hypothetical protein